MVHQYKLGGYNIVIDVCSGSIHAVDDVAYDVIEDFESHDADSLCEKIVKKHSVTQSEAHECIEQVAQLKREGKLFSEDGFERYAGEFKRKSSNIIKALCLHVAHTCNLSCEYCFASQGRYHGERALMSYEVGKRALDFLIENSGGKKNLEVDFFGGEPLMNWETVKRLVKYARGREKESGKHFRFTLTTNGVLVDDDVIDFCNREMNNVVLSLDGRREIHDAVRVDYAGNGSYDVIVPKFIRFAEKRGDKEYYMRGTFTHANPDFFKDIESMLALGFKRLSMEPVVCKKSDKSALTSEDIETVKRQYELLAFDMLDKHKKGEDYVFYHYMLDLKHGPCVYKRISGCGSGTEYMAVTPTGELYPCHQFVGEEKFRLGDIYNGVTNTAVRETFASCSLYSREQCRSCWARLYCSGGCAANAYHASGSINGVYEDGCKLFKKRMECAVMLAVAKELEQQ